MKKFESAKHNASKDRLGIAKAVGSKTGAMAEKVGAVLIRELTADEIAAVSGGLGKGPGPGL